VSGPLTTGASSVGFEEDRALVILVEDIVFDFISLGFKEIQGPEHLWHKVVCAHDFGFGGAVGI
jgi:hypothetical protein